MEPSPDRDGREPRPNRSRVVESHPSAKNAEEWGNLSYDGVGKDKGGPAPTQSIPFVCKIAWRGLAHSCGATNEAAPPFAV
jgi:hypothetical protein